MQTRLSSFFESLINIFIGYWIALLSQIVIFPLFDIHVSIQQGRKFIGAELKASYFNLAKRNMEQANRQQLLALLAVSHQTVREGKAFGVDVSLAN